MISGRLDKRIAFHKLVVTHDDYGDAVETWELDFNRRAEVRPLSGNEPYVNQQRLPEADYLVITRYDSETKTITPKHRIIFNGKTLEIESIINVEEDNKELRFFCLEHV